MSSIKKRKEKIPSAASLSAVPPDPARETGPNAEQTFVHDVYDAIAPHFSQTRYKPWPVVDDFLKTRKTGDLGADVGCGNGKYLGVNPAVFCVGSDRSFNLSSICRSKGHEAMVADTLSLPYRDATFDFVISIAVIHHLTTPERREASIRELTRILRPGGELLIFVWALEQKGRRAFDPTEQDVLVPWALTPPKNSPKISSTESLPSTEPIEGDVSVNAKSENQIVPGQVFQRYYHLFREGELDDLAKKAIENSSLSANVTRIGYDRDNWYVVIQRDS